MKLINGCFASKKQDKEDYYMNLPLRYIVVLNSSEKFKQKIKGVEGLLKQEVINGTITTEEAHEILGYKRSLI